MDRYNTTDPPRQDRALVTAAEWFGGGQRIPYDPESARVLTEEETAAITRNFNRGDFFVGSSAPVRIDPRLPVRLTLGEGDHVQYATLTPRLSSH